MFDKSQVANETCVFISSSDNTWDVAQQSINALFRNWPDCPFEIYVGSNTKKSDHFIYKCNQVFSPPSNWRMELRQQIEKLPYCYKYILLLLDDFVVFELVDTPKVIELIYEARSLDAAYLRFWKLQRSLFPLLINKVFDYYDEKKIGVIPDNAPYYSSLQISIWSREHLIDMLKLPGTIWDFEKQYIPGFKHYAIKCKLPIRYLHVVEKGKWLPYADKIFSKAGIEFHQGLRPIEKDFLGLKKIYSKLKFYIFGYAGYRIRCRLSHKNRYLKVKL